MDSKDAPQPLPSPPRKGCLSYWKLVLGLSAIFAMGMGTGAVGAVIFIVHVVMRPESAKHWVDARMTELDRRVKLTAEQKEKIRPIADKTGNRIREIGANAFAEILQTAQEAHEEISKELTPDQRKEFEKMRQQVIFRLRELGQKQMNGKEHEKPTASNPATR